MLANFGAFSTVLQNLASFFSIPTIGTLYYKKSTSIGEAPAMEQIKRIMDFFKIGIPIYPDQYEVVGGNNIGEQILIGGIGTDDETETDVTGALVKVADNIVVNPRVWKMHGYIGLNLESGGIISGALGMAGSFLATGGLNMLPKVGGMLDSFIKAFGREMFNETMVKLFENISQARRPFKFTTANGETLPALIKSYTIKKMAENQNWIEIDIEVQEFRYIALLQDGSQVAIGGRKGLYASGKDAMAQIGRTALRALAF